MIFFAALCSNLTNVILAYIAAFLHEVAHLWVCIILKIRVFEMTAGIFGMHLETEFYSGTKKKILVSIAGPLASFVLFAFFSVVGLHFFEHSVILKFSFLNLCIGAVNLIPVPPLDGGTILKALLTGRFGIIRGGAIQKKISLFLISVFVFAYASVADKTFFSVTLLLMIAFLIVSLIRESRVCMLEKKQVLCGGIKPGTRIRLLSLDKNDTLLPVAGKISSDYYIVAVVFSQGHFIGELSQNEIIFHIKNSGVMVTAGECLDFLKVK